MKALGMAAAIGMAGSAMAVINPFTETFSSSAANWSSSSAFTPLTYFGSGGPDGSGYASVNYSFANNLPGDQPLVFRGQSNFGSSGNAFVGNWIAAGVTQFSFSVRHTSTAPMAFFARFAPAAGPGAVAVFNTAAVAGEWTTYSVSIAPATPFVYEGTNFNTAFSNVARVQIGVLVDDAVAGRTVTLDIDNVGIIPAPASALIPLAGLLAAGRRRR